MCGWGGSWNNHNNNKTKTPGFVESGEIVLPGLQGLPYTYSILDDNINGRTLQNLSTDAKRTMWSCPQCPYAEYYLFYDYYAKFDYANQWIQAAMERSSTTFANGNIDFAQYESSTGDEGTRPLFVD